MVRIVPTLAPDSPLPLQRLSPSQANLRSASLPNTSPDPSKAPSPRYNSALLHSLAPVPFLLATYNTSTTIPAFKDAVALLRVWANQRGFGKGKQTILGFDALGAWWPFLVSVVVLGSEDANSKKAKRKPVGRGLSSYQLFRAVLDFLGESNLTSCMSF